MEKAKLKLKGLRIRQRAAKSEGRLNKARRE